MKKQLLSIIAGVAIFTTANTAVLAEQSEIQNNNNIWDLANYGISADPFAVWDNLPSEGNNQNSLLEISMVKDLIENAEDMFSNLANFYEAPKEVAVKLDNPSSDLVAKTGQEETETKPNEQDVQKNPAPVEQAVNAETKKPNGQVNVEPAEAVNPVTDITNEQPDPAPVEIPVETVTPEPTGKEITVAATAYTAECKGCIGITKTGVNLKANPDAKVIAVDPAIIPLGTKVYVEGFGYATAEDIGGGINGHEIDIFMPEQNDAIQWGRKDVKVTIID